MTSEELFETWLEYYIVNEYCGSLDIPIITTAARAGFKAGMKAVLDGLPTKKQTAAQKISEKLKATCTYVLPKEPINGNDFYVQGFNVAIDEIRKKFKEIK